MFFVWSEQMGLKLSTKKCGVIHLGCRNQRYNYRLGDDVLTKMDIVKDLEVRFSASLTFSEQVDFVVKKCSLICCWVLRSLASKSPSSYIKLYEAHVIPLFMYACVIWNPSRVGDLLLLEKMQRRFSRRVERRCGLDRHAIDLLSVNERMRTADIKQFKRILRDESMFDDLFDLVHTRSRMGFVIKPKATAHTERINHLFMRRVARELN